MCVTLAYPHPRNGLRPWLRGRRNSLEIQHAMLASGSGQPVRAIPALQWVASSLSRSPPPKPLQTVAMAAANL
jgi:hypothetical protein